MGMPDEFSFLSLFECEPNLLDSIVPYFYNKATYEFCNKSNEKFVVTLCPADSDIKIQVNSFDKNEQLSVLDFKFVQAIEILSGKSDEAMIKIKMECGSALIIFKPRFKVLIDYTGNP